MAERPVFTFRQAQSARDLICLARGASHEALVALSAAGGAPEDYRSLIHDRGCHFETDADLALYDALALAAKKPDSAGPFTAATAILLADLLQGGLGPDRLDWHVERFADDYRALPDIARAAIFNGFWTARTYGQMGILPPALPITTEDRITRPAEVILPRLKALAKGMPPHERESVSRADYGCGADDHLAALNLVIDEQDCVFAETGQHWYPSEVVELVAHVADTPGFVGCTAILLVNALMRGDLMGWFDYRWESLGDAYNALPGGARIPILAGLRYLYESDPDFMVYQTRSYDPCDAPNGLIGVVEMDTDGSRA